MRTGRRIDLVNEAAQATASESDATQEDGRKLTVEACSELLTIMKDALGIRRARGRVPGAPPTPRR
jgi:hypothetical protein